MLKYISHIHENHSNNPIKSTVHPVMTFCFLLVKCLAPGAVHNLKLSQTEIFVNQEKENIRRQPVWQKTYPATTIIPQNKI